ncbi:MAG: hypothetical protein FWF57_08690 [Defluviitaleaceae bacterium]|nr:hypothetical protein [Defluviitaleaceae bacterium]
MKKIFVFLSFFTLMFTTNIYANNFRITGGLENSVFLDLQTITPKVNINNFDEDNFDLIDIYEDSESRFSFDSFLQNLEFDDFFSTLFVETTFDEIRTITGTANSGTTITVFLLNSNENNILLVHEESVNVGPSEVFSFELLVPLGENVVFILFEDTNGEFVKVAAMRKMSSDIKQDIFEFTPRFPGTETR